VAEGAPLLREYRVKSLIEGSNPSLSARYATKPLIIGAFLWANEFDPVFVPSWDSEARFPNALPTWTQPPVITPRSHDNYTEIATWLSTKMTPRLLQDCGCKVELGVVTEEVPEPMPWPVASFPSP
jgi:hypothetical protein